MSYVVSYGNAPEDPVTDEPETLDGIIAQCNADSRAWFPKVYQYGEMRALVHHMLSLCGEVGEAANILKKVDRGSKDFSAVAEKFDEELIDAFIYLCNAFALRGIDPIEAYNAKRQFNLGRFA